MGSQSSRIPRETPLGCLLGNLKALDLDIRPKRLILYCNTAWPMYKLDNGSQWPENGTFNFSILQDLDNFCHRNGKWSEIPYVQAFFCLRSRPSLCLTCRPTQVLFARGPPLPSVFSLSNSPPGVSSDAPSVFSDPPDSLSSPPTRPPPYPDASRHPSAPPSHWPPTSPVTHHTPSHTNPSDQSLLCPLWEVAGAEGVVWVHVSFSLSDLSQIEKHLGSFSNDPTAYTKEFHYLTQAYDLTWHDIFVILSSTLTTDEKERFWVAAQGHTDQVHLTDRSMPVVGG
ncbi:natural cytotoxicity triggering receptor 3 ligand 1-like [Lemur catta]|uniref:natural cytotoxicity triggering receptor 3 ligand 1-like n=1 Tax=Lemur catta TaxID=9447 RepID=UPI001E26E310|nr:natural cytotoxicity triggering receptor 3 ligand 1-like [Lemur catta]